MKAAEDPRRIVARRAGGTFYNYWPRSSGGVTVPHSFHVSAGVGRVISVTGSSIRTQPPLRPGRSFFVQDVAGVIVGPRDGSNVLYDGRGEALAWFGMSEKNAAVLVQYLWGHGVPFYRLNGEPLSLAGEDSGGGPARRFVLELRRTRPVGMWIGLGLFLALALICVGFPVACTLDSRQVGRALTVVCVLACAFMGLPWVAAVGTGQLFPPQLVLDGEQMWLIRAFLPRRALHLEEIGGLRFERSDECYLLYDKKDRPLVKFCTRDDFGPAFLNFLRENGITLAGKQGGE